MNDKITDDLRCKLDDVTDQIINFKTSDEKNGTFDTIIGHIEDVLIEPEFQEIQQNFLEKYWQEFDSDDENKLIYMDIFNEYHKTIECYIENHLKQLVPEFSMDSLVKQLSELGSELEGEVFEVLLTFSDFVLFKEMFLDYKAMKEGKSIDLSDDILITPLNLKD